MSNGLINLNMQKNKWVSELLFKSNVLIYLIYKKQLIVSIVVYVEWIKLLNLQKKNNWLSALLLTSNGLIYLIYKNNWLSALLLMSNGLIYLIYKKHRC